MLMCTIFDMQLLVKISCFAVKLKYGTVTMFPLPALMNTILSVL